MNHTSKTQVLEVFFRYIDINLLTLPNLFAIMRFMSEPSA